jgi:hypothetical protein
LRTFPENSQHLSLPFKLILLRLELTVRYRRILHSSLPLFVFFSGDALINLIGLLNQIQPNLPSDANVQAYIANMIAEANRILNPPATGRPRCG